MVGELMASAGVPHAEIERRMASTLEAYKRRLAEALRPEHVRPKAGIGPLLAALDADPAVTLGLLTGNLEACARLKLEPLGVNHHFGFGAYGSGPADPHPPPAG